MPNFTEQQMQAQALGAENKPSRSHAASEAMGDIEFQQEIAARRGPMGYAMEMDPSAADFVAFPGGPDQYTTNAHYNQLDEPRSTTIDGSPGERVRYETQPGDLAVFGAKGANPKTWGHEYMHKELGTGENEQRKMDAFSARNKDEWDQAIKSYSGYRSIPVGEADSHMRSVFKGKDSRSDRLDRYANDEYDGGGRLSTQDSKGMLDNLLNLIAPSHEPQRVEKRQRDRYADERVSQTYIGRELRK
jgi:hypothetical protein